MAKKNQSKNSAPASRAQSDLRSSTKDVKASPPPSPTDKAKKGSMK